MIRTTILLTPKMNAALRLAVKKDLSGISFSALIRQFLANGLAARQQK